MMKLWKTQENNDGGMKMKRTVALGLSLLLCASLAACSSPKGEEGSKPGDTATTSEDYFTWNSMTGTEITGYTELGKQQTDLVIPARCTTLYGLDENPNLKSVTFENPDTEIQSISFARCPNLERVELPANLKAIPGSTFSDCESLQSIVIPDTVTEIGSNAFIRCTSLESITLSKSLETIDTSAFSECKALKEVAIPDAVTTIDKWAFENCESLATVTFGSGLKTIGSSAFQACNSLKSVKLQEGVTTLDGDAFALCKSLEEVYLPASIQEAKFNALAQTHSIKVYVVKGSFMDTRLDEMQGSEYFEKLYQ